MTFPEHFGNRSGYKSTVKCISVLVSRVSRLLIPYVTVSETGCVLSSRCRSGACHGLKWPNDSHGVRDIQSHGGRVLARFGVMTLNGTFLTANDPIFFRLFLLVFSP
jgi:hypothetical protein